MQNNEADHQDRLEAVKVAVCERFGWQRIPTPGQQFYAVDEHGHVLWLKARTEERLGYHSSWDWAKSGPELPYAALVGIQATPKHDLLLVARVPRPAVERLKHENQDSFRLRWNTEAAQDAEVEILFAADRALQPSERATPGDRRAASAQPVTYVCLDCAWHRAEGPEMAADGTYCVHFTPEYWERQGYQRGWGDASVNNWPHLLIMRKQSEERRTDFIILAPHVTRRPVQMECDGYAWGSY